MPTSNSINANAIGLIRYNGGGLFDAVTTTIHNILVGAASNGITNVPPSATVGIPVVSQGAAVDPAFGTAVVAGGGTGAISFTDYAVICGGTAPTNPLQPVASLGIAGQILTSNGAGALPSFQSGGGGFGAIAIQIFSTPGMTTYTPTSGMQYCIVELVGGGGGSGGVVNAGAGTATATSGGGGGGYARSIFSSATIGVSQAVTIGAGGTAGTIAGTNGGTGGTTSLGALISATGGFGSPGNAMPAGAGGQTGGAGGMGTGTYTIPGQYGGPHFLLNSAPGTFVTSGQGGNAYLGQGGGAQSTTAGVSFAGIAGTQGGGGGGALCNGAGGAQVGATGGAGIVVITELL